MKELMELKNYVNYLIEMVLSEQEDLNKIPLNDLKDIITGRASDENYADNHFRNTQQYKDIKKQRENLSGFTKYFRPNLDSELEKKLYKPMVDYSNEQDKKMIIGDKSYSDIALNIKERDNDKYYDGRPKGKYSGGNLIVDPNSEYQKSIKRIKEKTDAELARIPSAKHKSHAEVAAEAKSIEIEKNKPHQNISDRIIPNAINKQNKISMVAGAAGLAGLGVAGYAAYKLAKKRKLEKEKAKNKG